MAQPRFNGRGFNNPIDPLGFHAESRHRVNPTISRSFMSDEGNYEAEFGNKAVFGVLEDALFQPVKASAKAGLVASMNAIIAAAKTSVRGLKGVAGAVDNQIAKDVAEGSLQAIMDGFSKQFDDAVAMGKNSVDVSADIMKKWVNMADALKASKGFSDDAIDGITDAFRKSLDDALGISPTPKLGKLPPGSPPKDIANAAGNTLGESTRWGKWGKRGLWTAATGGTIYLVYRGGQLIGGLGDGWLDSFTGMDCGEKAKEEMGYSEDSEEYREFVQECLDDAADRMMLITGLGVAAVCGMIYVLVKK
jgi:hypothetical protein